MGVKFVLGLSLKSLHHKPLPTAVLGVGTGRRKKKQFIRKLLPPYLNCQVDYNGYSGSKIMVPS